MKNNGNGEDKDKDKGKGKGKDKDKGKDKIKSIPPALRAPPLTKGGKDYWVGFSSQNWCPVK